MASSKRIDRRGFLKGAAAGTTALAAQALRAAAPQTGGAAATPAAAANAGEPQEVLHVERPGADFMMDVLKSIGFEYCCANPASSLRGLHESMINYGNNKDPELITCCHEETSIAMAHGYAKIEGKPLLIMAHGTVGLQHGAMAIYNAFCDRVPVYILLGHWADANYRTGYVDWTHSVQDAAGMVREILKWDDEPKSLSHFAESAVRAYKIAMTPPMMPVALVLDAKLQESPLTEPNLHVPKLSMPAPPQGDSGAVAEAAKLLVAAENPVLVAGRLARTPNGIKLLIELAETLQAGVIDQRNRVNFPSSHPLYGTGNIGQADVILGLEIQDFFGLTHRGTPENRMLTAVAAWRPITRQGAKLISITALDLNHKSNYQDFGRYTEVDLTIAADAEATLPALIEACKKRITADRKRAFQERGARLAEAYKRTREQTRTQAALGWDSSPLTTARVSAELWAQIKNEDWSLVGNDMFFGRWPTRLWNFEKHYQFIGGSGGEGVGYGIGAAVGAALANKKHGRLTINIQNDGDLNYAPGALWTAAHHQIPMLTIMHNNRAYHQEVMDIIAMSARANRGIDKAHIGTTLSNPNIDYANMARTYGVAGIGPITDPKDLAPAIQRGIEIVKRGEPVLIDTVTQPR